MRHANQSKRKNKEKEMYVEKWGSSYFWHKFGSYLDDERDKLEEQWYTFGNNLYYCRYPGTMNEKRQLANATEAKEYGYCVRGRRTKRSLPSSYDDLYCDANSYATSWKKNSKRKNQWKYDK